MQADKRKELSMVEMKIENVEALGKPLGQYSHLTRVKGAGETHYIAGMLAPGETFDAQCSGVFGQIETALKHCNAGWKNVAQFTTYLVHSQDIPKFMAWRLREFPRMFPDGKYPPNTLLVIDRLVQEQFLIEVQTIAVT
jgi:enamine deaminase RidA (YjgF/YER057c/UK114 family)